MLLKRMILFHIRSYSINNCNDLLILSSTKFSSDITYFAQTELTMTLLYLVSDLSIRCLYNQVQSSLNGFITLVLDFNELP